MSAAARSLRPRCPMCNKPAPALTCTVWVERGDTTKETRRGNERLSGLWSRYIYPPEPLVTLEDCQRHSNQQVLRRAMWNHPTPHVNRFTEWDGETYWHAQHPFCSNPCAVAFARAAHKAGYRHRRDA